MHATKSVLRSDALRSTVLTLVSAVGVVMLVPLTIGALFVGAPWWLGLAIATVFSFALLFWWTKGAIARVVERLGVNDSMLCEDPGLVNLVEGLSLSIGLDEPTLYVIEDEAMNAMPFMDLAGPAVLVTSTLLETLERMEMEGVVAELLVRIKSGDAETATAAAGMFGHIFFDSALFDDTLPAAGVSLGTWAMSRVLRADGDIEADRTAVSITRYPPGLSSALTKIATNYTPVKATAGNDHLWIAPPLSTEAAIPHSPLQWRIDILQEF